MLFRSENVLVPGLFCGAVSCLLDHSAIHPIMQNSDDFCSPNPKSPSRPHAAEAPPVDLSRRPHVSASSCSSLWGPLSSYLEKRTEHFPCLSGLCLPSHPSPPLSFSSSTLSTLSPHSLYPLSTLSLICTCIFNTRGCLFMAS